MSKPNDCFSLKVDFYGRDCASAHMKRTSLRRLWFDLLVEDGDLFCTKKRRLSANAHGLGSPVCFGGKF